MSRQTNTKPRTTLTSSGHGRTDPDHWVYVAGVVVQRSADVPRSTGFTWIQGTPSPTQDVPRLNRFHMYSGDTQPYSFLELLGDLRVVLLQGNDAVGAQMQCFARVVHPMYPASWASLSDPRRRESNPRKHESCQGWAPMP